MPLLEHIEKLRTLSFKIGAYRPPSEGGSASLLLRVSENCPWNRCTFCTMYKGQRFVYRTVEEIKADIDSAAAIRDEIIAASCKLGMEGRISREVGAALLAQGRDLAGNSSFITVFNWLASGGKTAFLQDANSLIMRPAEFAAVLGHLRETLPSLSRVTTYARSKTLAQRKPEELRTIRDAGLDRLHIGLETGDDELLARICKGVTSAEQIEGGRKAIAAGFQVSEYWMPDLGGKEGRRQHAEHTARVLSAINPHYIRSRPLHPQRGTPLFEDVAQGRLCLSSPHERLEELAWTIGKLEVTSRVCFDHMMNAWADRRGGLLFRQDYEGYQFPDEKPLVMERIEEGLAVDESMHGQVRKLMAAHSL
ncbi:Radical SAM protein [Georgfuchsia toluolica]|uniref:Radical SAM protein n=1 Tax=Georgfuchsia toluolica TaxID=424218 RepID=A0A916J7E8_9PROT|nr:radical SAM protein [Georgfuchsia toluolica]CAG4884833.1 Radical SAM protein [Georgfuchsia toluolica]